MTTVLLTAFEPYDRWRQNASWLSLVEFLRDIPAAPKIVTRLYPVDFQRAREKLVEDLAADYDYAIHLGQAPGSAAIHLEAIGLNVGGTTSQSPDHFRPLEPEGPTAYRSPLPLADWAGILRRAGIPAKVSYHAGTYLCNAVLYLSLHIARTRELKTQSAFIHMPLAPQQVLEERGDTASLPTSTTAQALHLLVGQLTA